MMTKKHYVAIAEIITDYKKSQVISLPENNQPYITAASELSLRIADYFVKDNPNFDRNRFLKACGL
jgi:hypothetical protein